jgi:hypothetical protein
MTVVMIMIWTAFWLEPLGILAPEVDGDDCAKARGKSVFRKIREWVTRVASYVFNKSCEILARDNGADGAGEHVVEQQSGDRELGEGSAHGLFDHAVNTAADEHAAGLDVQSPHGVTEQHDREDEPGGALANDFLGVTSGVVGR